MKYLLLFILGFSIGTNYFAQSFKKSMAHIPDAGQTKSFTNTFGEDNDYSLNMPFYIDHGNGTITDTITGLMWQKIDFGEISYENASKYCDTLTLGGYTDWRLPTPLESFSILNLQNTNPALNTTFFPKSIAEYWWTNTLQYNDASKVWVTNAGGGIGNHLKTETISAGGTKNFFVRAVRDVTNPTLLTNRFSKNNDGTITDLATNLEWQQTPDMQTKSWEDALVYAENLSIDSKSDWRLPSIRELQSINDENSGSPSVNTTFFNLLNTQRKFWSSTTLIAKDATKAWFWDTQFGITTYDLKTTENYVLCVRTVDLNSSLSLKTESLFVNSIYPNPTSKTLNISTNNPQTFTYEITNNLGQFIFSGVINSTFSSINTQNFPEGHYILHLSNANSYITHRFVILHP